MLYVPNSTACIHTYLTQCLYVLFTPESVLATIVMRIRNRLLEQNKSSEFLLDYEVKAMAEFKGSHSYGGKIARQFGWSSKALHGETYSVDVDGVKSGIDKLHEKIKQYDSDNVFDMNETGLSINYFLIVVTSRMLMQRMLEVPSSSRQMIE